MVAVLFNKYIVQNLLFLLIQSLNNNNGNNINNMEHYFLEPFTSNRKLFLLVNKLGSKRS